MVLPSVMLGSSVTMKVEAELRDVTRVCTFTLPNSVMRAVGISSVNFLSSSGEGLSKIFLARMDSTPGWVGGTGILANGVPGGGEGESADERGSAGGFNPEVEAQGRSGFGDAVALDPGAGAHDLEAFDV